MADLAKHIEHTLLRSDATETDIRKLCSEAIQHSFFGVCVSSSYVALAKSLLKNHTPKLVSVVGFPLGTMESQAKAAETARAVDLGADEIDMVLHLGALKEKRYDFVQRDIEIVLKACARRPLKVILEIGGLSHQEKILACRISQSAGAQFVKTCTGFAPGQAEVADVELMRTTVGKSMGVKASGGIKTTAKALALIRAGADRLGTSSGVQLVTGQTGGQGY